MPFTSQTEMQLDTITFKGREIPEIFGDLGGKQALITKDFPGGARSGMFMGAFPADKSWDGDLWGAMSDVQQRAGEMNLLWQSQKPVNLSCGQWNYFGVVEEFEIKQKQTNWIKYHCKFVVFQDNSQASQTLASSPPQFDFNFSQSQQMANNVATSTQGQSSIPSAVQQNMTNLNNSIASNLQQSGGSITNFTTPQTQSIQGQITTIQQQLAPIMNGADPTVSSMASAMNSNLTNMSNALSPGIAVDDTLNVTNPNFFSLASKYYGNAGLWRVIAKANNVTDPQPVGTFTNLVIPNADNVTQDSTWLS